MNQEAKTPAQRKTNERERLRAMGVKTLEVKLSAREIAKLERNRVIRGGTRGPYDANEYLATLLARDTEQLDRDLSQLGTCPHCHNALPEGCEGRNKGDSRCWHHNQYKALML